MSKPNDNPLPQFKRFDRTNTLPMRGRAGRACLSMSTGGNFSFSKRLSELLQLRSGAAVVFMYDETNEQWYIQRDDKNGIVLRDAKEGCYQFNSSSLRKQVVDTIPRTVETGATMPVSEEPTVIAGIKLWTLITSGIELGKKRAPKP